MTVYRQGWLKVTCGLTACTPGSAPSPTLGNKYGIILPFYHGYPAAASMHGKIDTSAWIWSRNVITNAWYRCSAEVCAECVSQVRGNLVQRRTWLHDTNDHVILVYTHSDDVIATRYDDVTSKVVYHVHQPKNDSEKWMIYYFFNKLRHLTCKLEARRNRWLLALQKGQKHVLVTFIFYSFMLC